MGAFVGGQLAGFIAYGPTPMTDGTYDLYWIATDPAVRRSGIGALLIRAMEADLEQRRGRLIRVETSGTDGYGATRSFYERLDYCETARIPDFYRPADDLVILTKELTTFRDWTG
jgi:ribosomal protein S18 acetylase RimI-like enzyme